MTFHVVARWRRGGDERAYGGASVARRRVAPYRDSGAILVLALPMVIAYGPLLFRAFATQILQQNKAFGTGSSAG